MEKLGKVSGKIPTNKHRNRNTHTHQLAAHEGIANVFKVRADMKNEKSRLRQRQRQRQRQRATHSHTHTHPGKSIWATLLRVAAKNPRSPFPSFPFPVFPQRKSEKRSSNVIRVVQWVVINNASGFPRIFRSPAEREKTLRMLLSLGNSFPSLFLTWPGGF